MVVASIVTTCEARECDCAEPLIQQMGGLDSLMSGPALDATLAESFRPVIITGFLYFKEPLALPNVKQLLQQRILEIPRFRSVIRESAKKDGRNTFVELPVSQIDMDELVREYSTVKTEADLNDFCTKLYETDLGIEQPRWRAFIFNNMADGRSMLCMGIDHAIGDGPCLVSCAHEDS